MKGLKCKHAHAIFCVFGLAGKIPVNQIKKKKIESKRTFDSTSRSRALMALIYEKKHHGK